MKGSKILAAALAVGLCLGIFSGCGSKTEMKKIGVLQISQHPSLNTIRDSFAERMKELGYIDGENCKIEYQDAQGEPANCTPIVQSYKGDNKDIIVAITTPAAQAAATVSDTIPLVFSAITDPVDAGLADSLESTGKNITGTSDALQIEKILDFALKLTPDIKKLGYLYNSGEANSVSCLEQVRAYAKAHNLEVVESAIVNTSEVQQASQLLAAKVDAVFTPNDNTVALAMNALAEAGRNARIPVYVGADSMVNDGGFATIGIDYKDLGYETANMVDQILSGKKKASEIPVKVFNEDLSMYINKATAEAIGVTIPEDVAKDEKTVFFGE